MKEQDGGEVEEEGEESKIEEEMGGRNEQEDKEWDYRGWNEDVMWE
jgi:hypothetical protein